MNVKSQMSVLVSVMPDSATPWTIAHQGPLSMGFSRQEYWSRLPLPSPRDLPDPGIEPGSPALQADSLPSEPLGKPLLVMHICDYMVKTNTCHVIRLLTFK